MATLILDAQQMQQTSERLRREGKRIAFVPTMGALHEGHAALINSAGQNADVVITSVFVNPTQFGPKEDFDRYPRNLERDLAVAAEAGTDILFAPSAGSIYPPGYRTFVAVEGLGDILEGKSRPGHFRGVATILVKLFNITRPHVSVFGQKDAQQVAVVRRLVHDLNFDMEIVVVPTVRESDGLAMSSRNVYLSERQRGEATVLYRSLKLAEKLLLSGETDPDLVIHEMKELIIRDSGGEVEYISIADSGTLEDLKEIVSGREILVSLAVRFGATRLIDNCILKTK
jgi:pantoate--beta-alanine ligase